MKKIFAITLTTSLLGIGLASADAGMSSSSYHSSPVLGEGGPGVSYSEADMQREEDRDAYKTRTLRARQSNTTASPNYADDELQREENSKSLDERRDNDSFDSDSSRSSEYDGNDLQTRTHKSQSSDNSARGN